MESAGRGGREERERCKSPVTGDGRAFQGGMNSRSQLHIIETDTST